MTETQRRIKAYKEALPALRERVIAVALLLAMSASMLTSASFAWISLSTAPEVSGMSTTVAANGNLEIALAQGSTSEAAPEPAESAVGDSTAQQGIVKSNVTWGNLVNLSEPEYGISQITLRPALLSDSERNKTPLYGVTYGQDGRVVELNDYYEYASWTEFEENIWGFSPDKAQYGVRAISSMGKEIVGGDQILTSYRNAIRTAYAETAAKYKKIITRQNSGVDVFILSSGRDCITALEGIVTVFAQDKINTMASGSFAWSSLKNQKTSCSPYLYDFYEMLLHMQEAMQSEGEGLRQMANWQAYSNAPEGQAAKTNTYPTLDDLLKVTPANLKAAGINLTTYQQFYDDYAKLKACISKLVNNTKIVNGGGIEAFKGGITANLPTIYYEDVSSSIDDLVTISTTEINGIPLGSVGGSNAMQIINGGDVVIKGGILARFEKRALGLTSRMAADVVITVKVKIVLERDQEIPGHVTTDHGGNDGLYLTDLATSSEGGIAGAETLTAKDTYGMAIDLWVRTNYPGAVLTLEGSTQYIQEPATTVVDGKTYNLYNASKDGMTIVVYEKDGTWYDADSNQAMDAEFMDGAAKQQKMNLIVSGYQGENRIWEDWETMVSGGLLERDATTQGAGSCFVFYSDTPAEQQKLLEMLENFRIVFLDEKYSMLALATLDIENTFANQGKMTVPLEITSNTGVEYTEEVKDVSGTTTTETKRGIMKLPQNQATRITAIVYLDGSALKNENVLAAGELMGQLNMQFGSSQELVAHKDETLQGEYRSLTATAASGSQTSSNVANPIKFEYDPNGHNVEVTVKVEGTAPDTVSGFFMRRINDSQGTRMETVDFKPSSDDKMEWKATFTLTSPGTYIFNEVLVNGAQYRLGMDESGKYTENYPSVTIDGMSLNSVTSSLSSGSYMTANSSYTNTMTVELSAAQGLNPQYVTAQFYSDNEIVTAVLSPVPGNGSMWRGDAVFNRSGTYTLRYVTVGDQFFEVPAGSQTKLTFYLGLRCEVYNLQTDENNVFTTEFIYKDDPITAGVAARIWDDSGNEMENLSGVELNYSVGGSLIDMTSAEMKWMSDGEYYSGVLQFNKPNMYSFNSMIIGSSGSINSATVAPVYQVNPADPPAYVEGSVLATQLAVDTNTPAALTAKVTNAQTVQLWAKMVSGSKTVYVLGTGLEGADDTYSFDLNGLDDGTWTMENMYANDFRHEGTDYTKADPNTQGIATSYALNPAPLTTRIIKTLNVTATMAQTEYTGGFMAQHQPVMNLSVKDSSGNPVTIEAGGTWTVQHTDGTQYEYGGYNEKYVTGKYSAAINGSTVTLDNGGEGIRLAGKYTTSSIVLNLSADNGTSSYTVPAKGPEFAIRSELPEVKITAVTPGTDETFTATDTSSGTLEVEGISNYISPDKYHAIVYMKATKPSGYWTYSMPSVTMELNNVAEGSGSLTMTNAANGDTYVFDFSESKTSNVEIGAKGRGIFENEPKYNAGTAVFTEIPITYNGNTYKVRLKHSVTVEQLDAPAVLMFSGFDDTISADQIPEKIVLHGGKGIVTFPEVSWTAETVPNATYTDWTNYVKGTTNYRHYYQWETGSWRKTTHYRIFDWSDYTRSRTLEGQIYEQDKEVDVWTIGTETYIPGQTYELNMSRIHSAIATISNVGAARETDKTDVLTETETLYGYEVNDYSVWLVLGTVYASDWTLDLEKYPNDVHGKIGETGSEAKNILLFNTTTGANGKTEAGKEEYKDFWVLQ